MNQNIDNELSDVELLEIQYEKYKDKTGKKAQNLLIRIDGFKALAEIYNSILPKYEPHST